MGSTRSAGGLTSTQSERIRSRLRGALKGVKVKLPGIRSGTGTSGESGAKSRRTPPEASGDSDSKKGSAA